MKLKEYCDYDMVKSMLNVIRENNVKMNDGIDVTGADLESEQSRFMEQITPRVDFTVFKIYPANKNAVFSGKFQDMNGAEFQLSLEENEGLYINANNLQLTDEVMDRLTKLKGYYKNWSNEWANKLSTEYNNM